jgi:hypothetical protein
MKKTKSFVRSVEIVNNSTLGATISLSGRHRSGVESLRKEFLSSPGDEWYGRDWYASSQIEDTL